MDRPPLNDSNYIKNLKTRRFFDSRLKWCFNLSQVKSLNGLSKKLLPRMNQVGVIVARIYFLVKLKTDF